MATKKSGPTLAALNAQIAALQAQADALRKKEVAEVVAKIKDAIAHYGLTAADLGLATGARKNAKLPAAGGDKPASKQRKKAGPKPSARTVKFKDDKATPGVAWASGRHGSRLLWLQARHPRNCWQRAEPGAAATGAPFGGCLSPVRAGARIG